VKRLLAVTFAIGLAASAATLAAPQN